MTAVAVALTKQAAMEFSKPEKPRNKETGKAALAEMRRLLGNSTNS